MQHEIGPPPIHHEAAFACVVVAGAVAISLLVWFLIGLFAALAQML